MYSKAFFGKIDEYEFITVETFFPGTFQKYNNNDGRNVDGLETSAVVLKRVEEFAHYTYKKSKGNLKVLDIRGIGNVLLDTDIATGDIVDIDDEFLFCSGNSTFRNANQAFSGGHECHAYCDAVNLPEKTSMQKRETSMQKNASASFNDTKITLCHDL